MASKPNNPGYGRVWNSIKKNERSPEYDGRLTLFDGTEVRIALWPTTNGYSIRLGSSN